MPLAMPIAYLSTDDLDGFCVYDELPHEPLRARGFVVERFSWHARDVDWNRFAAVVLRSTWDYQTAPLRFLRVFESIDASSAALFNDIETVRWNLDKRYLGDLRGRGVEIPPTMFLDEADAVEIARCFDDFGSGEIVVKLTIGEVPPKSWAVDSWTFES